jgi:hypothetical protein
MFGYIPSVLALHIHDFSGALIALVGLISLGLAAVGYLASKSSLNPALKYVTLAFLVFGAKGLFATWAIVTDGVAHEDLELILSAADLIVVLLLVAPLVSKRAKSKA